MDSIVANLLKQVTTGDNLSNIAKSVGGDEKGVQSALGMALPMLMGSMANNAKSGGADNLMNMVTQTAANNPLDNLGSLLGNPEASGGSKMVNMLLGNKTSAIQDSISQKSGLTSSVVSKILAMAAPMLMGSVSKMFAGQNMTSNSLTSLLGEQSDMVMKSSPEAADMAKQFLGTTEKSSGGIMAKLKKIMFGG
jgi:hypothetical protein